ncbi:MAG: B12-binding domain-containing radical SAM protein [Candidatus Helarchaeota archaeon]
MRILLINPKTRDYGKGITIAAAAPLGLLSIAAVLLEAGHKVMIYDHNIENSGIKKCLEFNPELVGVSSFTGPMIKDGLKLSKIFHNNDIPVVWGGVHASLLPSQTVEDPRIDMVIVGEGEETIVDLADSLENNRELDNVKGLVWKKGDKNNYKIITNEPRPFIDDLDKLPFPAWELIDEKKYLATMMGWERSSSEFFSIQTSRGCPFRCGFCYNIIFNNRKWRCKSKNRVIEEISFLKDKYKVKRINFRDDNFVVNKNRTKSICKELYKNKFDIEFGIDCRVDLLNKELGTFLKIAGCDQIYFGIESGSPRILKFIRKDITLKQAWDAVKLCKKLKIKSSTSFIIGFPTETKMDLLMTEKFIFKLRPDSLLVKMFVPYPGSQLYNYTVNNKLFNPPNKLEDWGLDWTHIEFKLSDIDPKLLNMVMKKLYKEHFILKFPNFIINLIKNTMLNKVPIHRLIYNGLNNVLKGP